MNALGVENPRHKWDLGNKNDSVTDKKITIDNIDCNNNYHNYYTEIILYLCVCVRYNLHSKSYLYKKRSVKIKTIRKRRG